MHEAQQHEKNSFLTLTYNEEALRLRRPVREPNGSQDDPSLPSTSDGIVNTRTQTQEANYAHVDSLVPSDAQLFMKRLRFSQSELGLAKVRYYLVGEYGERTQRPHYHIALFGEDFSDDRIYHRTSGDYRVYRSSRLQQLWGLGNCEIGELTTDSAAYIARYVMKKINGKKADQHYRRELPDGEILYLVPEFAHMSRRPGLGKSWLEQYIDDVYPHDHVVVNGHKFKPPRYYDKLMEAFEPGQMAVIKFLREARCKELEADNTPARLADKEAVTKAKLALKKRNLE